jgi:hypothetical protein
MTDNATNAEDKQQTPEPNPSMKTLDVLIGTWHVTNRDLNTGREWHGQDTFEWLDGGFFLAYHHEEFSESRIKGLMLIGFERVWGASAPSRELIGHWFDSTSGDHFVYVWEIGGEALTFWLGERGSTSAFRGRFSDDRSTITGRWEWPGGGYESTLTRVNGV